MGFQQQNVTRGFYLYAAVTSVLIGLSWWFTVTILSKVNVYDFVSLMFFSYIVAGPIAIMTAMKAHRLIFK